MNDTRRSRATSSHTIQLDTAGRNRNERPNSATDSRQSSGSGKDLTTRDGGSTWWR